MLPSRWKSFSIADTTPECVALLSFLPLKTYRKIPAFIQFSIQTQRQLQTSEGLLGYSLQAQLLTRRFWTLSAWEDETALLKFVQHPPHSDIMSALAPHMGRTAFVRWIAKSSELPLNWNEAKRRYHDRAVKHCSGNL
jgi:hypothetical protein